MLRISILILCVALVLALTGCLEEKEVINRLQFSDQASQAVVGGWARFPLNANMEENAGTYEWKQETSKGETPFLTKLYIVDGIVKDRYPVNPSFCYILVTPEGEEDEEVTKQVKNQILADLQCYNMDLTGDGRVDEKDLQVMVEAADRPKGKADAQAPALLKMIPSGKDLAVHPCSKMVTTWGRLKK